MLGFLGGNVIGGMLGSLTEGGGLLGGLFGGDKQAQAPAPKDNTSMYLAVATVIVSIIGVIIAVVKK